MIHWHLASFFSISAGSFLALCFPLILKWLIDSIIPQRRLGWLLLAVLMIFLAHQGRVALTSLGNYLMLCGSQKLALTLRIRLLKHLDTLSSDYYDQTAIGAIMYPLKEPIEEVAYFGSDLLPAVLRMILSSAFTVTAMVALSPVLTVAIVPLIPLFLFARQYFRQRLTSAADTVQRLQLTWSSFLEEHLSYVIPIQLLTQEKPQERKALRFLAQSARSQLHLQAIAARFTISSSLAIVLAMSAAIGLGARSVMTGALSLGSLVAFYSFVSQLFEPLSSVSELYARTQKTFASVRQLQVPFGSQASVTNRPFAITLLKSHAADIEFDSVEFSYSRLRDFLHVPFLRIAAGEQIAITGENGAGKSTLAKLAARLYDPAAGTIRFAREDLRNIQLKSLRRTVCYLPRDPVLFDGTILSNLRFVRPDASLAEIENAMQLVGLSSLMLSFPKGLRHPIGPDGGQLSGGERQRLALARAILQQPRVLILDEATSCLDPSSEVTILRHLQRHLNLSSLIVISHRLSTVSEFGRALLVSHGRVVRDEDSYRLGASHSLSYPSHNISTR